MFYTLHEIARIYRVHPATVVRWVRAGQFVEPIRVGRKYLFLKTEVDKLLGQNKTETTARVEL